MIEPARAIRRVRRAERSGSLQGVAEGVPPGVGVSQPGGRGQPLRPIRCCLRRSRRIAAQSSRAADIAVAVSGGRVLDPPARLLGTQRIRVDPGFDEGRRVGERRFHRPSGRRPWPSGCRPAGRAAGGRARPPPPPPRPGLARPRSRPSGSPPDSGGRIDPGDQQVTCLLDRRERGRPGSQVAHGGSLGLAAQPCRLLDCQVDAVAGLADPPQPLELRSTASRRRRGSRPGAPSRPVRRSAAAPAVQPTPSPRPPRRGHSRRPGTARPRGAAPALRTR